MPRSTKPLTDPNEITRSDPLYGWTVALERAQEAVVAWSMARSVHQSFGKGRDPFYSMRDAEYVKAEANARATWAKIKRQARTGFGIDSNLAVRRNQRRGTGDSPLAKVET